MCSLRFSLETFGAQTETEKRTCYDVRPNARSFQMIWWNLGGWVPNILKRFIWDSSPKLGQSTSLPYHPADPFQQVFVVTGSHIGSNLLILICFPSSLMTSRPSWLEQNLQGRKTTTAGSCVSCPLISSHMKPPGLAMGREVPCAISLLPE